MHHNYIEVDSDFILNNSEKIYAAIEKERQQKINDHYSKMIGKKVGFIFKRTINTIDEAIKYDRDRCEFGCGTEEFWIDYRMNLRLSTINQLVNAARIAKAENKNFYATTADYSYFLKLLENV